MTQLRLPGILPSQQVTPAPTRPHPTFFVRRLRVLDALSATAKVHREVDLKPGLNIVWAPPVPPEAVELFQNGIASHTAGKTTLVRMVRYVLGARTFAREKTWRRIREKIPLGWVTAEIVIKGASWSVARPLGPGDSHCLPGADLDVLFDQTRCRPFHEYQDALARAVLANVPSEPFPGLKEKIAWEHILPWLIRDQECRFADFIEWHHPESKGDAPVLHDAARQFLVRSVLGLISGREGEEQRKNARLNEQLKAAKEEEPALRRVAETDHRRLQEVLGISLTPPIGELLGSQAEEELKRRTEELSQNEEALKGLETAENSAREALERAIERRVKASADLELARRFLAEEEGTVHQLSEGSPFDVLAHLPPTSRFCSVPIAEARAACPIYRSHPFELSQARSRHAAADELEMKKQRIAALAVEVERLRALRVAADEEARQANLAALKASTIHRERVGQSESAKARLGSTRTLALNSEASWRQANDLAQKIKGLESAIKSSYAEQDRIRAEEKTSLDRFSGRFDYVVRALLGEEVQGRVEFSGRSLALVVDYQGERDSTAIATVRLLAFDLAALTESVEGNGAFPGFLIHDGPREGDMAGDIYERLFLYAREVERACKGQPTFQYIVTTTSPPPTGFKESICLELAATPEERRFLRMNL